MTKYIGQRLLASIPTVIGVCLIVFCLMYFSPYDAALEMARVLSLERRTDRQLAPEMGLDEPFFVQLSRWFGGLFRGDLGKSFVQRMPVTGDDRQPALDDRRAGPGSGMFWPRPGCRAGHPGGAEGELRVG